MKTKNIYLTIWQEFGNSNVRQLQIRQVCSAGKLLLFLIFSIMNPNEQNPTTPRRIECKVTDLLVRFREILNRTDSTQQDVHDTILALYDKEFLNEKESGLVTEILNAFLSLSFVLKANPEEIDKFIEYYD